MLVDPLRAQELAWEELLNSTKWQTVIRRLKKRKRHGKPAGWGMHEYDAWRFLRYLCALREFLLTIIKADPGERIPISPWLRYSEEIQITGDGLLWVKQDLDCIKAFDALCLRSKELLRLCPICQRIFVVDRTDKQVCSKGCRVRKSRQLHLDTYLEQEARRAQKERLHYSEGQQKRKDREAELGQVKAPFKPHVRKPRRGKMKSDLTP